MLNLLFFIVEQLVATFYFHLLDHLADIRRKT